MIRCFDPFIIQRARRNLCLILACMMALNAHGTAYIDDGERLILAECVHSASSRAKGLMYRLWLPPHTGMLFVFPDADQRTFWMKNTLLPLDIRFYDAYGHLLTHHPYANTCFKAPCPLYRSNGKAQYVLETRANDRFILSAGNIKHLIIKACH